MRPRSTVAIGIYLRYLNTGNGGKLILINLFGLPLLNQVDSENYIIEDFIFIMPKHQKLNEFMDNIIENYTDSGVKFPISMWAKMNRSSERTTNACESIHSKYNSLFYTHFWKY